MKIATACLLLVGCSDGGASAIDAAPGHDAPVMLDAPRPDAPPMEVCSSAGWCQSPMAPGTTWALSVAPDGTPWTAAYGVRVKRPAGWQHYDITWKDLVDPFVFHTELYTVHALSPTDVWAGGRQGYVGHFNGGAWIEYRVAAPWPQGIYGASANDVWVLYDSGLRYRWNGTALMSQPTSAVEYSGAWGAAANDVWGWGETQYEPNKYKPAIDHFDGTNWTMSIPPGFGTVISVWASNTSDVYAVITLNGTTRMVHFDGTAWTTVTNANLTQMFAVWGRAANDVWAVGAQGRIAHYDGTSWTVSVSGVTTSLTEIAGTSSTIWVTGNGVALHKP